LPNSNNRSSYDTDVSYPRFSRTISQSGHEARQDASVTGLGKGDRLSGRRTGHLRGLPGAGKESSLAYFARIVWQDTCGSAGWDTAEEIDIREVEQWGWVVFEDDTQLKVADTYAEEEYYGVTAIPKGCVTKVTRLEFS